MGVQEWVALGGLILALFTAAGGIVLKLVDNKNAILEKISENKEALDAELLGIRMAAFKEYEILRREINDTSATSYRDFGESLAAIREKVTQIELWIRDELRDTRHTLQGAIDMRHQIMGNKLDAMDERVRKVEIEQARHSV